MQTENFLKSPCFDSDQTEFNFHFLNQEPKCHKELSLPAILVNNFVCKDVLSHQTLKGIFALHGRWLVYYGVNLSTL